MVVYCRFPVVQGDLLRSSSESRLFKVSRCVFSNETFSSNNNLDAQQLCVKWSQLEQLAGAQNIWIPMRRYWTPEHRFDHSHVLTLLKLGPLILGQVLFLISTCIHCTKRCQSSSRIDRILLGSQYEHLTSSPQFSTPPLRKDFASPLHPQSSQICEK